jgi:hypothetical protein
MYKAEGRHKTWKKTGAIHLNRDWTLEYSK